MKNWKRLLALLLAGMMALSLFACNSGDANASGYPDDSSSGSPDSAASGEPSPSATPEIVADLSMGPLEFSAGMSAGDVLFTVNGDEIPADLFLYWLDYNCYYFMSYYGAYLGLSISDYADDLVEDAAYFCVSEALLRQKAAELGCLPTDAQVQEAQDSLDEATSELLKSAYGLSDESISYLIISDAYYDNVLAALTHDPDGQELAEYLEAQGFYRVKHILLSTVDTTAQRELQEDGTYAYPSLDEETVAQKEALANDLLAQLQGADNLAAKFDELMNEYSEDGRDDSGALYAPDGYLTYSGEMDPAFEAGSLALEEGGLSELVESSFGYHIILRLPLAPFTDSESAQYSSTFRDDAMNDLIAQWQEEADIVRADALSALDPEDFYNRLMAYQDALTAQEEGVG